MSVHYKPLTLRDQPTDEPADVVKLFTLEDLPKHTLDQSDTDALYALDYSKGFTKSIRTVAMLDTNHRMKELHRRQMARLDDKRVKSIDLMLRNQRSFIEDAIEKGRKPFFERSKTDCSLMLSRSITKRLPEMSHTTQLIEQDRGTDETKQAIVTLPKLRGHEPGEHSDVSATDTIQNKTTIHTTGCDQLTETQASYTLASSQATDERQGFNRRNDSTGVDAHSTTLQNGNRIKDPRGLKAVILKQPGEISTPQARTTWPSLRTKVQKLQENPRNLFPRMRLLAQGRPLKELQEDTNFGLIGKCRQVSVSTGDDKRYDDLVSRIALTVCEHIKREQRRGALGQDRMPEMAAYRRCLLHRTRTHLSL